MRLQRIALIFDDQVRPDTTGVYCRSALKNMAGVEVEHFQPSQVRDNPPQGFDCFLQIDDGLDLSLPPMGGLTALWAIDTHLDAPRIIRRAQSVDAVFAAQKDGVELLRGEGVHCVGWLPLACDPEIHRKHDVAKEHDICFVGHVNCPQRSQLLEQIAARHANTFVGQLFFEQMARKYSQSRLVFNRSVRNDLNMRVFEALACGSMLITNELGDNGLTELMVDGKYLATYRTTDELFQKLEFYLDHEQEREQIAAAGRSQVLSGHTYAHRMAQLIEQMESLDAGRATITTPTSIYSIPLAAKEQQSRVSTQPRAELTSIIVLTHNQLHHTRECLSSVRQNTSLPYELIVVDNGSTDGTVDYLKGLGDVRVIINPHNRGFPAAVNQGICAAKGGQILLLNNDTIVTAGWLERLLRPLAADAAVGLVGPCSNWVSGEQQIKSEYVDLSSLEQFAQRWAQAHEDQTKVVKRLVGFCLLLRRAVVERIGLFDEQFGIGNFEDDDICRRALRAGFKPVIARDCFVHHAGSATFRAGLIDHRALLKENQRRFEEKWANVLQFQPPQDASLPENRETSDAGNGADPAGADPPPLLSLCMIVRDSARTLPAALESVRPFVDEMVVVDTGSKDGTAQIAREAGAEVYHFPWCDDFSAARNCSLGHARGQWIFWMDSDDTISAECGRRLRELATGEHDPRCLGYVMQVHCPGGREISGEGDASLTVVDHIKLFRNRPELRFEGRIHEQILPAIRRAGGEVGWTDLFVTHSGSDQSPAGRRRKWDRDMRLLQLELCDRPGHTFALFNLGMTCADAGQHEQAIFYLNNSLKAAAPGESHVRKAYALLAASLGQLGRHEPALNTCQSGLQTCPDDPELTFRCALALQSLGRMEEAEQRYLALLVTEHKRCFSSIDPGILSYKARQNLAVLYAAGGKFDSAEKQWREVLAERPGYRTAWRGLAESLVGQGRFDELDRQADSIGEDATLGAQSLSMKAAAALARGDPNAGKILLNQAAAAYPQDAAGLESLCSLLFHHGTLDEAEQALRRLTDLTPDDPAAHHNLGAVCLRKGKHHEAVGQFRQSLHIRPRHGPTHQLLAIALSQEAGVESSVGASAAHPQA